MILWSSVIPLSLVQYNPACPLLCPVICCLIPSVLSRSSIILYGSLYSLYCLIPTDLFILSNPTSLNYLICEIPYVLLAPYITVCPLAPILSLSLSVPWVLCNLSCPLGPACYSMFPPSLISLVISCLSSWSVFSCLSSRSSLNLRVL
jgi:hypothetical protein